MASWAEVTDELARWADAGMRPVFWMRDDDAVSSTRPLERLASLGFRYDLEVGLAVIPSMLQHELAASIKANQLPFVPMCHGWRHIDHRSEPYPAEFGPHRALPDARADLAQSYRRFVELIGDSSPYFVPPFGQIGPRVAAQLAPLGFGGLSNAPSRWRLRIAKLNARKPGLPANPLGRGLACDGLHVHIDPIDWRQATAKSDAVVARTLLGELRARRKRHLAPDAPIGLLTHHLVHDKAIWDVCKRMFEVLRSRDVAQFPPLAQLMQTYAFGASGRAQAAVRAQSGAKAGTLQPGAVANKIAG